MKKCLSILVLLAALCAYLPAQTTFRLFFLGGQSNMEGFGRAAELPYVLRGPVQGVYIFHGNSAADTTQVDGRGLWSILKPGHGAGFSSDGEENKYSDRFGLELTFARQLREWYPNDLIAIIKYSRGGTSIATDPAHKVHCWDPDFNFGNGINQYDHCLATIRQAFMDRDIDGDGKDDILIPSGILWMQGESDGNFSEAIALAYEANLKRLMDLIRAALWQDDLPVVIGRISDSGQDDADGKVWNHGDLIRAAQAAFVQTDGHAALVTSTDAYHYSDKWHYDTAGYLDLGRAFAQAIKAWLE
ncbi:MAG TPA: sialate O-acetylesterase [Saprospiraceae bacterium]|nr:sialate O-acetylesterase [Saprospiraceae bacterium]HMQ81757.1 sialate O-acetylesterase [Saprospiraceae bacterium]